ncbi:MAG: ribonuclease PH, partial [Neisseriaceae bacterium]|nr:ribonuclease PH [Neisseriaceae bacterium]
ACDLTKLGERQIIIDCDVIQADGGTRCASITGGFVALSLAINKLLHDNQLTENPLLMQIAAVSVGVVGGVPLLDLDYIEDSGCDSDMNVIMGNNGKIVEIQGTAEGAAFNTQELTQLLGLAEIGITQLFDLQQQVLTGVQAV